MSTDDSSCCACLRSGVRHADSVSYAWVLYDRRTAEAYLASQGANLDSEFAAECLSGFRYYYRGPGRVCWDEPYMLVSPFKVLVKQRRCLNV